MSIHRMAALGASIMVLTAGALTGGTAGAAGQAAPSERAAGMVGVSIDRAGVITMPTALPPGVTTFKITTTRRQAGLQLVAFAPGYTVEQATLDVENGLDKNRIKALQRFEANTTLLGGASASRDKAGKLAVDLDEEQAGDVRVGRALDLTLPGDGPHAVFAPGGQFLALYEQRDQQARPVAVFV